MIQCNDITLNSSYSTRKRVIVGLSKTSKNKMSPFLFGFVISIFGTASAISSLGIKFDSDFRSYNITVNNQTWLQSGLTAVRSDKDWAPITMNSSSNINGYDNLGEFTETILRYIDQDKVPIFNTHFRTYPSHPNTIVFIQSFLYV